MPDEKKLTFKSDLVRIYFETLTQRAINHALNFRPKTELAFISGAGIAGLCAAFELLAKGFKVVIAEKRTDFSRFNVINLDVEVRRFLKKFNLLDDFEASVAARISSHELVHYTDKGFESLSIADVSKLEHSDVPFEPQFFNQFFTKDGVYSVRIKDLQNFLAQKALDAGARLFGNLEMELIEDKQGTLSMAAKSGDFLNLVPALSFIAEGACSKTPDKFGMRTKEIKNECTGENWIFGNVKYTGAETFVVSMIDTSEGTLQIANIIFNSKIQEANIAVTSTRNLDPVGIRERILMIAQRVFTYKGIEKPLELITCVKKTVPTRNLKREYYSRGNVFCMGDAAGCGSPLAGMGATLAFSFIAAAVAQLLKNREQQPKNMHFAYDTYTEKSVLEWMGKSVAVKKACEAVNQKENEKRNTLQC